MNDNSEHNVTEDGWTEFSGHQYYIAVDAQTMDDARKICKEGHGDLVVINSEAERTFLWTLVREHIITRCFIFSHRTLEMEANPDVNIQVVIFCPLLTTVLQISYHWSSVYIGMTTDFEFNME